MFYSHISATLVIVNLCAIVEHHIRFWKWPCIKPQSRLIIRSHFLRTLCQHVFAALALTWSSCLLPKKNTRDRYFGCFSFILISTRNSIQFLIFKVAGIVLLWTLDSNNFSGSDISPEKLKTVDFVSSFNPQLLSRFPSNTDVWHLCGAEDQAVRLNFPILNLSILRAENKAVCIHEWIFKFSIIFFPMRREEWVVRKVVSHFCFGHWKCSFKKYGKVTFWAEKVGFPHSHIQDLRRLKWKSETTFQYKYTPY